MDIIYKKMNVGKSVEMSADQKENTLTIVYNEEIYLPNVYIWDNVPRDIIESDFDMAIKNYSDENNLSMPTLLFYTNEKQEVNQWLFDIIAKCPYISNAIIYCKED